MSLSIEKEVDLDLEIDYEDIAKLVIEKALDYENCPYESEINLILTDDEGIRVINKEYRNIDRATDVLSFPMVDYEFPSDFSKLEDYTDDYFNPETGELVLGDIIISIPKVYEQAENYGHSIKREFAFLVCHSMLHLFGYDHMEESEASIMEKKQADILEQLGITR
ncbi:probable rRNA maturation factor [Acetitomaculum ruminis DSM 5522]|uniref:Endoribonuclease YbeY n=1 Tax=Acetitomaculum ruminis DSM 5522 TaxID=1120918 RepID=A0A1I0V6D9_9FIRM|nr:rRNA maturation RNase YbeY [Acetitomaculum ruminis]SFA71106.1 probable rRNA maturation factor [Acetitomaculum ruminis DSM 5522]